MPASAPARSDAQTPAEGNVFSRAMRPVNTVVERFIPSSLMFTIVLTFLVAILCLTLTPAGPLEVLDGWGGGLAGLRGRLADHAPGVPDAVVAADQTDAGRGVVAENFTAH